MIWKEVLQFTMDKTQDFHKFGMNNQIQNYKL